MKCQSHIFKTFKRTKADPIWPYTGEGVKVETVTYGKTTIDVLSLPVCGGEVTVKVKADEDAYYGGVTATLTADFSCTNCKYPWVPQRAYIETAVVNGELDISAFLDQTDMSTEIKAFNEERVAHRAKMDALIAQNLRGKRK